MTSKGCLEGHWLNINRRVRPTSQCLDLKRSYPEMLGFGNNGHERNSHRLKGAYES